MTEDLIEVRPIIKDSTIEVYHGDSRNLDFLVKEGYAGKIQWIITSPPYPTEHDYSRISRIELELAGFVHSIEDLRAVKRMQLRSNSKTVYSDDEDWKHVRRMRSVQTLVNILDERAKTKDYMLTDSGPGFTFEFMVTVSASFTLGFIRAAT